MIRAKQLAEMTVAVSEFQVPETLWRHLKDVAATGKFHTVFYVHSELAIPCNWSTQRSEIDEQLERFKRYMENLGYSVEYLYPWGDGTKEVDEIRLSW